MSERGSGQTILSIQYLRGAAALLVVLAHALLHPLPTDDFDYVRLGRLGVVLFFVISGFIIVTITGPDRFAPAPFLWRRATRIAPLYWLLTSVVAAVALAAPGLFKTTQVDWAQYLTSMLFIPHDAPGRGNISPILRLGWSLNYEVYFYLCFAALAWMSARQRVVAMTLVFTCLAIAGSVFDVRGTVAGFYLNAMPLAFLAGAWIGLAHQGGLVAHLPGGLLAAIAALCLVASFLIDHGRSGDGLVLAAMTLASTSLVLLGLRREAILRRRPILLLLGDASYAIYLFHMFVIGAALVVFRRFDLLQVPGGYPALVVLSIAGSTIGGIALHVIVERPLLQRLRGLRPMPRPTRPKVLTNFAGPT